MDAVVRGFGGVGGHDECRLRPLGSCGPFRQTRAQLGLDEARAQREHAVEVRPAGAEPVCGDPRGEAIFGQQPHQWFTQGRVGAQPVAGGESGPTVGGKDDQGGAETLDAVDGVAQLWRDLQGGPALEHPAQRPGGRQLEAGHDDGVWLLGHDLLRSQPMSVRRVPWPAARGWRSGRESLWRVRVRDAGPVRGG